MGKRAAKATSPKPSPKKAKADPTKERVQALAKFFKDEKATDLPASVRAIVQGLLEPSLSGYAADRHPIEQIFAGAIGDALKAGVAVVGGKNTAVQQASAEAAQAEEAAQAAAAAAEAALSAATEAELSASNQEEAASNAKTDAEKALTAHKKDEAQLDKTKVKHESDVQEYEDALKTATASEKPPTKEVKKLVAVLKAAGAAASLYNAAPNAVGNTDGFEAVVCLEMQKVLNGKLDEMKQLLSAWDAHVQQMASKNGELTAAVQAAAAALEAREQEHQQAGGVAEAAQAAKKAADTAKKQAAKTSGQKQREVNEVQSQVEHCEKAQSAYDYLFTYKEPVEEAEVAPEAPVDDAEL